MPNFHNKTRKSSYIPTKLIREGNWHLLPIYYLLLTSELAREGIENSGSYRFADHIYENKPKGRFFIGKILDAILLNLESAQSLRARYIHAKEEIHKLIKETDHSDQINILAVPCGLAREFFEIADELKLVNHPRYHSVQWHGIDLDEELIGYLRDKIGDHKDRMRFKNGDAFNKESYQEQKNYDMIISTGFTEFLANEDVLLFYRVVYENLKSGGTFFTSGMLPHKFSEYLMKNIAELHAHYRSEDQLKELAYQAGFENVRTYRNKLQTILIGVK